jgi:hypothetical protein
MIDDLISEKDLTADDKGILRFLPRHTMMNDPKGFSETQKQFLKNGLAEAQNMFQERYHQNKAKFLSVLMTAPEKSLGEIFTHLKTAVEKTSEEFNPEPSTDVGIYRVQLQVYRLVKAEE